MESGSSHRELEPSPDLQEAVECFWSRQQRPSPERPAECHVLPDGCVDIIFDLGELPERSGRARAFVVGTMTRPRKFVYTGSVDLLGVRFRPGIARSVLGVPIDELTDLRVPLEALSTWEEEARRSVDELLGAAEADDRVRIFQRLLRRRRDPGMASADRVRHAIDRLMTSRGTTRIGEVADSVGVSRQHLTRRFKREIGVPPKLFARIVRFRAVTEAARSRTGTEDGRFWTEAAHRFGFSDQSHLTLDFREFSGLSPERWLQRGA